MNDNALSSFLGSIVLIGHMWGKEEAAVLLFWLFKDWPLCKYYFQAKTVQACDLGKCIKIQRPDTCTQKLPWLSGLFINAAVNTTEGAPVNPASRSRP